MTEQERTYNPNIRQAEPGEDDSYVERIEIDFAIPVWLTPADQQELANLIQRIARSAANNPVNGVHWLFGSGAKPSYSLTDARFLGKAADPEAPFSGEPTFDSSILYFETAAREK